MATASGLVLLLWVVPVQLAGTCLRCWPDVASYFTYDSYLLLGRDSAASDKLVKLFLGDVKETNSYGNGFLERDHMEREAGNLFHHLEQIIRRTGKNREELMREAELEKQDFINRLEEASNIFLKEICSFSCGESRVQPYEVVQCKNCHILKASCYDLSVCAGPNVIAAVVATLVILLGAMGAAVWYFYHKRKAAEETESQGSGGEEEDDYKDSSESSDEWEETDPTSPAATYQNEPPAATYQNEPPEATYQNQPQDNIPSPPEFNIPSPPSF